MTFTKVEDIIIKIFKEEDKKHLGTCKINVYSGGVYIPFLKEIKFNRGQNNNNITFETEYIESSKKYININQIDNVGLHEIEKQIKNQIDANYHTTLIQYIDVDGKKAGKKYVDKQVLNQIGTLPTIKIHADPIEKMEQKIYGMVSPKDPETKTEEIEGEL